MALAPLVSALPAGLYAYIIAHTGEDGAFYLQIAKHIAAGHGVTFDGIHSTTGVHWGWLLLLAGWLRVFGGDFGTAAALYFAVLLLAAGLLAVLIGGRNGVLAAVFLVLLLGSRGQWLTESHLVMLTLASLYLAPNAFTGFILVLARYDLFLFLLILSLGTGARKPLLGAALALASSFLLNYYVDGHFLSISGTIKAGTGWNDWAAIWENIRLVNEYYFPVLQITTFGAILYAIKRRDPMLVSALIACLLMVSLYILKDKSMGGWYLAPLLVTTLIMAVRMIPDTSWPYRGFIDPIKSAVKPGQTVFMEDLSGKLALATGRQFVSGDGLVNSYDYLRYLVHGRVADYLKDQKIDYYLTSNIRCDGSKRYSWTRDIDFDGQWYRSIVDVSYLTNMPVKPSILTFDRDQLVFDLCSGGYRELLFHVKK